MLLSLLVTKTTATTASAETSICQAAKVALYVSPAGSCQLARAVLPCPGDLLLTGSAYAGRTPAASLLPRITDSACDHHLCCCDVKASNSRTPPSVPLASGCIASQPPCTSALPGLRICGIDGGITQPGSCSFIQLPVHATRTGSGPRQRLERLSKRHQPALQCTGDPAAGMRLSGSSVCGADTIQAALHWLVLA